MAEPTPALARGTADMSCVVIGDMVSENPAARTTKVTATWR
jgi:hypothetical protein